ncbi:hypothetical protein GGS26DRAFT_479893 [Hypomontagnella submonticulosa]|nr:hypothetical protein GGS26DRAFT_479893 [Hypomontagnella submonticulosa]
MGDSKKFDLINRGAREPTPWGTLTFVGLRAADVPLQHALQSGLGASLLSKLGLVVAVPVTSSAAAALLHTGVPALDALGHPTSALLVLMAAGSAAKQIYWQTALSFESFPVGPAAAVAAYNTVMNGLNSLLFLAFATTSLRSQPQVPIPLPFISGPGGETLYVPLSTMVGTLMYVVGLTLETVAERQRKVFKDAPENKGKVCKVGVWRWARHINYFGYSLWRGGFTMVATGWIGGLAMMSFQMYDLGQRAASVLDEYCTGKYKDQWIQFKREVPYKLIPGVW